MNYGKLYTANDICFQRVSARRNYELNDEQQDIHLVSSVSLHVGIMNYDQPISGRRKRFQRVSARRNYEFFNKRGQNDEQFPACLCT